MRKRIGKIGALVVLGMFVMLMMAGPVAATDYDTSGDGYVGNSGEERIFFDDDQAEIEIMDANVGIGYTTPEAKMDIRSSNNQVQLILGDRTGNTDNDAYIGMDHWTGGQESVALIGGRAEAFNNRVYIGGGTSVQNAATEIKFYTADDTTTLTGTQRMVISDDGGIGIGTSAGYCRLTVCEGTGSPQLKLSYDATYDTTFETNSNGYLEIYTYGNRVGIGTNQPNEALDVNGKLYMRDNIKLNWNWLSGDGDDEGVYVASDGNVGVGTISPDRILDLEDSTAPQLRLTYDGTGWTDFKTTNDGDLYINPESLSGYKNVGIGTANPQNKLDVEGSLAVGASYSGTEEAPANGMIVQGDVGIGVAEPSHKVEISDSDSSSYRAALHIEQTGANPGIGYGLEVIKTGASSRNIAGHFSASGATNYNTALWIESGNVGIGCQDPQNLLDVEGGIAIGSTYSGAVPAPSNGAIIQGDVGIGTHEPDKRLEVKDSSDVQLRLTQSSSDYTDFKTTSIGHLIITPSGGYVGIGATSPVTTLDVNGGLATNIVSIDSRDSPYDPPKTDFTILADAYGGSVEIRLPWADDNEGRILVIKRVDEPYSATNQVIIDPNMDDLDGSSADRILSLQHQSLTIQSDGSDWFVIGAYL